jgi:sarcosine oxidase subunit beta
MERTQVIDMAHSNAGFTLQTSTGQVIKAPVLLNCAGAWASFVAEKFNETVPMISAHPTMAVTEPLPNFMSLSLGVEGGGIYARQAHRGNCVIGGSRGFALDELRARPSREAIQLVLADRSNFCRNSNTPTSSALGVAPKATCPTTSP